MASFSVLSAGSGRSFSAEIKEEIDLLRLEAPGQTQALDEPHSFPRAFTHPVLHSCYRSKCCTLT